MRSFLTTEVPVKLFLCEMCETEKHTEHTTENGSVNIIYDVIVPSGDGSLSIPVDVKKLKFVSTPHTGIYDVFAEAIVDCPCCDTKKTLRYKTQAPRLLIASVPCPACGGDVSFNENILEIDENGDVNINGRIVCKTCSEVHYFLGRQIDYLDDKILVSASQVKIYNVSGDFLSDNAIKAHFGSNNTFGDVSIKEK